MRRRSRWAVGESGRCALAARSARSCWAQQMAVSSSKPRFLLSAAIAQMNRLASLLCTTSGDAGPVATFYGVDDTQTSSSWIEPTTLKGLSRATRFLAPIPGEKEINDAAPPRTPPTSGNPVVTTPSASQETTLFAALSRLSSDSEKLRSPKLNFLLLSLAALIMSQHCLSTTRSIRDISNSVSRAFAICEKNFSNSCVRASISSRRRRLNSRRSCSG